MGYLIGIITTILSFGVAVYEICTGGTWSSLPWFFNAVWGVSLIFISQNQEKINKLDEINRKLDEMKKDNR